MTRPSGDGGVVVFGILLAVLTAAGGIVRTRELSRRRGRRRATPAIVSLAMAIAVVLAYLYYVKVIIGGLPTE